LAYAGRIVNRPTLWQIARYFLVLGCTGFGGPVALANYMRKDLVERLSWLSADEYDEGLAIATACPGPLAYQLGVYCGFLTHRVGGAFTIALAFAAGPVAIVVAVAALYVRFGSTWELRALFYGIGSIVVGLIVKSCWDLGKKTLRRQRLAWIFAAVACVITILVQKELTAIFLVAGALGIFLFPTTAPPSSPGPPKRDVTPAGLSNAVAAVSTFQMVATSKIFLFFLKTGFLVFGSGLVIVPFLKAYVVDQYHWLGDRAFLDAVAVGLISPGPVVVTATFVGYLLNNLPGALAATAGIFAPSLAFVIIGTPILRRYRTNARVQGFIRGVTVAVVGVLVGTSYLVARSSLLDWVSITVFAVAVAVLFAARKIPDQLLIGSGALIGLIAYPLLHR